VEVTTSVEVAEAVCEALDWLRSAAQDLGCSRTMATVVEVEMAVVVADEIKVSK
jgi:hypothetical protein